jgi:hypothetical protein
MNALVIGTPDKTDLLLELSAELFQDGVTIIDPTGQLAQRAANALPLEFTERALYFDPTDYRYPVGLNVLESGRGHQQQTVELLSAWLDLLSPGGESTLTRLYAKPLLQAALRLLLEHQDSTLLQLLKLLSDNKYRQSLLTDRTDPVVRQTIDAMDEREYANSVAFLLSNFRTLFMNPLVRNIVGQTSSTINQADIIIANLDRATLGDDTAKLLGILLMVHSRGQVLITDYGSFKAPLPLSQERFTISLNYLSELPASLQQAVLGIDDKYVLKTTLQDAEELKDYVLKRYHHNFDLDEILGLAPNQYRTAVDIHETRELPSSNRLPALRNRTRARHARPVANVEQEIAEYLRG